MPCYHSQDNLTPLLARDKQITLRLPFGKLTLTSTKLEILFGLQLFQLFHPSSHLISFNLLNYGLFNDAINISNYITSKDIKYPTFCPNSVFTCFVWFWEPAVISLHSTNCFVSITETENVYCEVRNESLYDGGTDKSLARPTSRCRTTESIVSL